MKLGARRKRDLVTRRRQGLDLGGPARRSRSVHRGCSDVSFRFRARRRR
jgi:hypothetical protein